MKLKSYYFIFAAATIMFGCSNEGVSGPENSDNIGAPDENGMVYVEFTAGAKGNLTRGNAVSRTALQDDGKVFWSPNDEINVFHAYSGFEDMSSRYPNHIFVLVFILIIKMQYCRLVVLHIKLRHSLKVNSFSRLEEDTILLPVFHLLTLILVIQTMKKCLSWV